MQLQVYFQGIHCSFKVFTGSSCMVSGYRYCKSNKSTKSDLLTSLEKKINLVNQISADAARVYDCMCIIRQLPTNFDTFRDLSDCFLKRITLNSIALIFFTTDQYWKVSIKSCESTKQSRGESIRITAMRPEQKLPKQ